ncbi:MAG: hypothetical protein NTV09_08810 [Bacteroidetes bacterium]|nr:hypothetical protein [Bacteroidota bacterium]
MSSKKNLGIVAVVITLSYITLSAFNGAEKQNEIAVSTPTTEEATINEMPPAEKINPPEEPKGCVFRTVFGEENSDSMFIYKTPAKVSFSMDEALEWMAKAQLNNGGFGAGTHAHQDVLNPHEVQADPATTAMVAMAILRSGSTLNKGMYSGNLKRALNYLLEQVEESVNNEYNITDLTGTQPQVKLGQNIDVVLTSQFFTNLLSNLQNNPALKDRVVKCNNKCLVKIQRAMAENGSIRGAGWAGVLQSSFATNALETARDQGMKVDDEKLEQAKNYQKNNFDIKTNKAETMDGAGVMLYSLSSTTRSSAKEAREAKDFVEKAKREGKVADSAPVSVDALKKSGLSESEALRYGTAYEINQAAKKQVQRDDVMEGFGSNGGEEFLSYLQTGEGLIMSKDNDWKKWYNNITGRLVKIQNDDGSWNGHHCITSPVFCTATALLILSVNNDVQQLMAKK